ncbi:MAG: CAP domain-containing protein [Synergistaceae bacterium]|nr:CAP domain-containing protein [Synergistaceae bacterium]
MRLRKFAAVVFVILVYASALYASDIYDAEPSFSPYYAGSVKSSELYSALEELNYIRWLIGVPNNVTLDSEYTVKAQHGAVLLDAIDTLTHTPGKPSDMCEEFYSLGYDAASHGNIAVSKIYSGSQVWGNITLSQSTRFYMDDSDDTNISRLGHRRWLMNPRMTKTGFGISTRRGYAVTYVIEEFGDGSRTLSQEEYARYLEWLKWPVSDEFITWPTRKHPHPLEYFDAGTAWSIVLNSEVFNECSAGSVNVRLTRESDGRMWNFSASGSDGYFNIAPDNIANSECIIFRPDGVDSYRNGETWRAEVYGLSRKDGRTGSISFSVQFTGSSATNEGQENPAPVSDNDNNTTTRQEIHHYYHDDDKDFWDCNPGWGAVSMLILGILCVKKRAGQ